MWNNVLILESAKIKLIFSSLLLSKAQDKSHYN